MFRTLVISLIILFSAILFSCGELTEDPEVPEVPEVPEETKEPEDEVNKILEEETQFLADGVASPLSDR